MEPLKAPKSYAQIAKESQEEVDRLTAQLNDLRIVYDTTRSANMSMTAQLVERDHIT